jgi:[protein-PII] uridylyltransferase
LEPNIKRSRGGLRDLQLLRWIGFARYGTPDLRSLARLGALGEQDTAVIERANEFLLWLRNELHFYAGHAADVLDRAEQLRIAELAGYQPVAGMLPVEQFMRDYFRHTGQAAHVVTRFVTTAQSTGWMTGLGTALFGHHAGDGLRVGPSGIMATRKGLERIRGNLDETLHLIELANLYDVPIATVTWEAIRREASHLPGSLSADVCQRFLLFLSHPARLGSLLRDMHEAGILSRFIPEFEHARGLLQFNQYHKYTVDEHCIRAVEFATDLFSDPGSLGEVYRQISQKHILHLALLIHDLGKGLPEDHCEVALKIAEHTAQRLQLARREAEALKFLAHRHLLMNHLAFRRDIDDEQLVVRFAVQVGSPEMLRMLFVMTGADLGAIGPGMWDGWKDDILSDLYHRTMQHLAADSPAGRIDRDRPRRRDAARAWLGSEKDDSWFTHQLESLPGGYFNITDPKQIAADLRLLHELESGGATANAQYRWETESVEFTIATSEQVTPGIFHKLTGALTSHGLQIRSAQIHTLTDGLVLDRFWVYDPDYAGEPPPERLNKVNQALVQSLLTVSGQSPSFRRTWRMGGQEFLPVPGPNSRVEVDNSTSKRYTIVDIFAPDRTGLLYAITRTLFELDLSVWRAKIGTYLDQVVDVFYVTDQQQRKIENEERLEQIRHRLLEVIDSFEEA